MSIAIPVPPLEMELPVASLPDDPAWRENFCFDGYDAANDIGFWIHCGRWSKDPSIWREQVLIYLPDGDYMINRSWGYRESKEGVSAALLDLVCEIPGRRWRLHYRGPGRRASQAEVLGGPLPEGAKALVELDIVFSSEVPIWDMSASLGDSDWGKFHIEQTGRFQGSIAVDGQRHAMDGFGWRDHSRGPRDNHSIGRHAWIHGNLSRGRSFALTFYDALKEGQLVRNLDKVVIWDGGQLYPATCPNPPMLESTDVPSSGYQMRLEYERGTIDIEATVKRCLPHSTTRYNECFDGICPDLASIVTYEQGTIFRVDGELHNGHSERSFRFPAGE